MLRTTAIALLIYASPAVAQHMHDMQMEGIEGAGGAQIFVTINPEARVSAVLGNAPPRPAACGAAITLRVKIINQGGITARLRTRLIDPPNGVMLHDESKPLTGRPDEQRMLHVMSDRKEATDLTIAFSLFDDSGDLADRDRVHMLFRCLSE